DGGVGEAGNGPAGHTVRTYQGHTAAILSLALSPDCTRFVSASADGTVKVWDATVGQQARACRRYPGCIVMVQDEVTGQEAVVFGGHPRDLVGLAFSPDGQQLTAAGRAGDFRLYDVATGREQRAWGVGRTNLGSVSFSPDRRWVAAAIVPGEGQFPEEYLVKVWALANGQEVL